MSKNPKLIPKNQTSRTQGKSVRTRDNSPDSKPSWRFSTVDRRGPFAWPCREKIELEIIDKLRNFDSMTWDQFLGGDHHHLEPDSISKDAITRLEELHLEDEIDKIYTFHLQGKPRIVCIRELNIGKLLWFDPEHLVSKSTKK